MKKSQFRDSLCTKMCREGDRVEAVNAFRYALGIMVVYLLGLLESF